MRRRAAGTAAALLLLAGCAAGPGRGGDAGPPVGARARAHNGPDPVALPPPDLGNAEDPAPTSPK